MSDAQTRPSGSSVSDLEVKDAQIIFDSVWASLEREFGRAKLSFPREIFWLNGAPGAGKGTNTQFILQYRDYGAEPIVVSDLLSSPEAKKRIDAGMLVGDREVVELLFRKLLEPQFETGAVVDGFPRSMVQVECLKHLFARLNELRQEFRHSPEGIRFPKPHFHILVLFVDENESVRRQLKRGSEAVALSERTKADGAPVPEIRKTDLSAEAARNRYRVFKERTYEPLQSLRDIFHYHFINAHGSLPEVQARIIKELQYQSSLELSEETYDLISPIPLSSQIVQHARQDLVRRLDDYAERHAVTFRRVIDLIQDKFLPIIRSHAISGQAHVNTETPVFDDSLAIAMFIDIFSERGFHAVVDLHRIEIPESVEPFSGRILTRVKKVWRVSIRFEGSEIRRGGS
ncbi:MAG: nucleoside monophosphate kinase [Verrucomicrobiae bacterium]|nr:nucleoside monophosphate kinase [Verrucomicrobiae bacterium]